MKSSVRILAIALALAFLLLARTAFQEDPASAKEHIDLDDGEAAFADPLDGTHEANYLGFGGNATATVYFYIQSKDLGTQVTARTKFAGDHDDVIPTAIDAAGDNTIYGSSQVYTLIGGNTGPAMVDALGQTTATDPDGNDTAVETSAAVSAFDGAYCANRDEVTAAYTNGDNLPNNATTTMMVPGAWGLTSLETADNTPGQCPAPGTTGLPVADRSLVATTTADTIDDNGNPVTGANDQRINARNRLANAAIKELNDAQHDPAVENNALQYEYKSGKTYVAATSTNPKRRYTNGVGVTAATPRDTVGGANKPLSGVVFKVTDKDGATTNPADDSTTNIPTFESNNAGGQFRLAYTIPTRGSSYTQDGDTRTIVVDATFDIVDVYAMENTTASGAAYPAYTSGFSRAWVSSGSDSGQWVMISEVADETNNSTGASSPTSNLFQGMVVITNDTDHEDDNTIYAQDGDTLTLEVYDENGNRSSDVIATATALIDDSPPTISDLSPADESILSDDTLRVSFNVNDEGAGADFRNIAKVVPMVEVQARDESITDPDNPHKGTGAKCPLASGDDIDNAGGNASSVGVLVAPSNKKFSTTCGNVVKTTNDGKFNLIITAEDKAGNKTTHTTQLTIDTEKPTVEGNPEAGNGWDEDKNKSKSSRSSILIEFSEALDPDTVAAADFTVAGYSVDTAEVVGTNDDDKSKPQNLNKYVVLTLTEDLDKNARPSVTVETVSDVAGNVIQKATRTSDNKIKAALTVVPFAALVGDKGEQSISFTSDEALRSKSGDNSTQASVNGTTLAVKVSDDTMGGSATFKETKFGDSRAYGVIIQAVDVNGNVTRAGAVTVDDDDVKLDLKNDLSAGNNVNVKLANWPPADSNLNGSFAGEVVAKINNEEVASSTKVVHWDGTDAGKVQLVVGAGQSIDKDATLTLSYKYVTADQVIQVDVDKPTMTSVPKDNSETDYAATAVQFKWAEGGEYAGDTYKTVTLNSATYEGPSGTSTDITDMLTTNDNKTWIYRPAEDLPLGNHEFTVKATDAAGNDAEVTVNFKVIERKPVEIGLSPGWNLISFRGAPASSDANDIFGADSGISVVTQYDGRRVSPWTVWTRGEDGTLSSSPAGRTNIDPGLGLYVLSSDGSTLEVDIPGTSKDDPARVPPSIDLIAGWNLIAVVIVDPDTDEVQVDGYLPAGVWSRAFVLNNDTSQLSSISPGTVDEPNTTKVKAGQALWVYATKAGTVTPSD